MNSFVKTLCIIFLILFASLSANAGGTYYVKVGEEKMLSFTPKSGFLNNTMVWRSYDTSCVSVKGPQYTSYTYVKALAATTSARGALVQCEYKYMWNGFALTATEDFYIIVEDNTPKEPTGISMQSSLTLNVGDSYTLYPTVYPSGVSTSITWSTNNRNVASVTSGGRVTGESEGTATIYATTSNGYVASCYITVKEPTITLSISNTNTSITKGTKIALKASPSSANIYYTLDGTEPDINSTPYIDSIIVDKTLTIKAIGIKEGYHNSNILVQNYTVASLRVLETYPENSSSFNRTSIIPCITLNENVFESDSFEEIRLYKDNIALDGDVIISGNTLYFNPIKSLGVGEYKFLVPSNSFRSINGDFLEDIVLSFKINALHNIKKVETSYDRVMMISNNDRLYLYGIFPEVKSITGQYYDQYDSPAYIDANVNSISSGEGHLAMIKNSNLYVWGRNLNGQLGSGTISIYNNPIPTQVISPVKKVMCGSNHTIFLQLGNLYSFGWNEYGQLGLGHYEDRHYYRNQIPNLSDVTDFDCGSEHNVAILSNHDLYSWGDNKYGQLGLGDNENRCTPEKIMDNIISAEASYADYTLALKDDGSLWGFGKNDYGQLGINHTNNVNTPTLIMNDVVKFSAGFTHAMALTSNGDLYGWGSNIYRQIINSEESQYLTPTLIMRNIKDIEAGDNCTIAFTNDGTMLVWGCNIDFIKNGDSTLPPTIFSNVKHQNCEFFNLQDKTIVLNQKLPLFPVFDKKNYDFRSISWESSNSDVVQCTEDGIIKGVALGTAVITANITNFDGTTVSASCSLNVGKQVSSINISDKSIALEVGGQALIKASALPDDAVNTALHWFSKDDSIASVENGIVTAIRAGTTDIVVETTDGSNIREYCKIDVEGLSKIEKVSVDTVNVVVSDGNINVVNVPTEQLVSIYLTNGTLVMKQLSKGDVITYHPSFSGTYIVSIGQRQFKVLIP